MNNLAIVALTANGLELGRRLAKSLGYGEALALAESARPKLQELFQAGRPLVCIMALGIVVRILGPMTKDKKTDPPVVVVDEAGRFAISVLGGHEGGANELANQVALAIAAIPVITTASEVLGIPPLDILGQHLGWRIEGGENLSDIMAAAVKNEAIALYQDVGQEDWWKKWDWPRNFQRIRTYPRGKWSGLLVISDQFVPKTPYATVIYRPSTLVLGVGCRRGTPAEEIDSMFQYLCKTRGYSPLSLGEVATASLKADETGLQEFAAKHGVSLRSFTVEELSRVADLPTPSAQVQSKIGIAGVAEPAAMLAAGASILLVPKYRGKRVTMALARKERP